MRLIFKVVLLLVLLSFAYAAEGTKKTGTFSNLSYHKEAGDLVGYEIRIVYTRNGYEGSFQSSEGEPDALIIIRKISIADDTIKFFIPGPSRFEGVFVGRITEFGLVGVLTLNSGNKIDLKLKRGKSYWD